MATSGKQLSSLPSASSIAGNNEFLTWVGNDTAQKVSRDDFIKSLPTYRQPNTAYTAGQIKYHSALPTGWYLECTTEGTTGSSDLTISSPSIGGTVSDGTVVWTVMKNLPLSGGAMTGETISRTVSDSFLRLSGTNYNQNKLGATLLLCGGDRSVYPGAFNLLAEQESYNSVLAGYPDGDLYWNNHDLASSAIVAQSLGTNGYIKYASGLIMQWGHITTQANVSQTVTLPVTYDTEFSAAGSTSARASFSIQHTSKASITVTTDAMVEFYWITVGH